MPNYIWYACYGSNLLMERFLCYIKGGTAPGSQFTNPGARDDTLPVDIRPYTIERPLYFGEKSSQWQNGGVGFLEIEATPNGSSHGRIYKITDQQFEDVVLQENRLEPGSLAQSIARPEPGQSSVVFETSYGRILCLEILEDTPVFTFTRPTNLPKQQRFRPSIQYLTTIIAGLLETNPNIKQEDVISYFMNTEAAELGPEKIQEVINNLENAE
jgi:hypothetical protein